MTTTYKQTLTWKVISIVTVFATIVSLSGVVYLATALNSLASLGNETAVGDVTGDNPRIAADGESERVALGLNMSRTDTTNVVQLNAGRIRLSSDDSAAEAAVSNIEKVRFYTDSSLSGTNGVFDENDTLLKEISRTNAAGSALDGTVAGINGAGDTVICVTETASTIANGDTVKIGTGATAEIRTVATLADTGTCTTGTNRDAWTVNSALTYEHADAEVARELAALVAANAGNGAILFGSSEIIFELGDPNTGDDATDLGWDVPKTDSGSEAGNDLFVVIVTADGAANQTVKVQVDNTSGDIEYWDNTADALVDVTPSTQSGTTDGKTKSITFGTDGVAPTITKVESIDSNNDGIVDRFKVYFSESMASSETSSANFKDSTGGTDSRINALDASGTDLALGTISWSTTTNLNDTATIDVSNTTAYTSRAQSTGDTWTVVYDEDNANDLTDATGTELADASITTTDKARPYLESATVHDLDGDGQVDELRVRFSESLGSGSTTSGFELKSTSVTPNRIYTLNSVAGFATFSGSDNQNDVIKLALAESGQTDLNDTFTLSYTAGSTVLDPAGNEAQSRSGVVPSLAANPVVTKVEYKDNGDNGQTANNGKIDSVEVTFTCTLTEGGTAENDMVVAGYVIADGSASGKVWTSAITEGTVVDGGNTPQFTYTEDGDADKLHCGDANEPLQNVTAGTVVEADKVDPVLSTATLYESNANDIWEAGETLQLFFLEAIDASTVASSWNVSAATGATAWTDWKIESADATAATDAEIPDTGTISVSGRVVNLTATSSATSALGTGDKISVVPNEVKDPAGNSAFPVWDITAWATDSVALVVTPTTAPTVDEVRTADMNGNGVLDTLEIHFNGMIDASTLVMGNWAAARGANFTIATAASEAATSTNPVVPDLTITSVMTKNGGNDSVVLVKFAEANEGTGLHPQVKYVLGSLADLAGNKVATFNAYSADNAKFETTITKDSQDFAAPVVVHKLLKDRNMNGKYDQLLVVFSEGIDNDTTPANALAAGAHSATGWAVSNHSVSSNGTLATNDGTYDAYTFASTNAVLTVEILEGAAPTSLPSVTYASTGNFADEYGNTVLADVAAGGEMSEIAVVAAPMFADGDLVREAGSNDVYIVKLVGVKKFKRLILNPAIFNSYGHLSWASVQDVVAGSLASYTTSMLIKEDVGTKVWKVSSALNADTGTKQWLNMTPAAFEAGGYDWNAIYITNSSEVSEGFYATGADITS